MKIDAGTIYGFAAVSLLTGTVECTQPSELEEIEKRADDIRSMLGDVDIVHGNNSYFPHFTTDKWPFVTDYSSMMCAANAYALKFPNVDAEDLDIDTLLEILKRDEIESKYRLSLVKKDVMRTALVPF